MDHRVSKEDIEFRRHIERRKFPVAEFDHRSHLRLAYIYLVEQDSSEAAVDRMRDAIFGLLKSAGMDPADKYHETLTRSWILAVHHFMNSSPRSTSAEDFITNNPDLLDSRIMQTHYSAEVLFSDAARRAFLEPDVEQIPRYSNGDGPG